MEKVLRRISKQYATKKSKNGSVMRSPLKGLEIGDWGMGNEGMKQ